MVNLAGSRCFARFRKNILILTKPRANAQRVVKSVVIPTGRHLQIIDNKFSAIWLTRRQKHGTRHNH